jgi:hypothetical protein
MKLGSCRLCYTNRLSCQSRRRDDRSPHKQDRSSYARACPCPFWVAARARRICIACGHLEPHIPFHSAYRRGAIVRSASQKPLSIAQNVLCETFDGFALLLAPALDGPRGSPRGFSSSTQKKAACRQPSLPQRTTYRLRSGQEKRLGTPSFAHAKSARMNGQPQPPFRMRYPAFVVKNRDVKQWNHAQRDDAHQYIGPEPAPGIGDR